MPLMRLSILELNDNLLVTLEPGTFCGLSQLKRLNLKYNHWTNLTTSTFDGLRQLEILYINSFKVLVLQPLTFMSLSKLAQLDMHGVPVVLTNNSVFKGMNSLTKYVQLLPVDITTKISRTSCKYTVCRSII